MKRRPSMLIAAAIAAAAVGCSLLGNFSTTRCSTSDDCAGFGLRGAVCVEQNCVAPGSVGDGSLDQATDTPVGCKSNLECSSGVAGVCVEGNCVPLRTTECPLVTGDDKLRDDSNTLLFGAFVYLNSKNPAQTSAYAPIDKAVKAINAAGGLLTSDGLRYLSVLVCTKETPAKVKTGVSHLLELSVPAIFGQLESAELLEALPSIRAKGTLFLSTFGNDFRLKQIETQGAEKQNLLWFLFDDVKNTAAAFAPALALAEAKARSISDDPQIKGGTKDISVGLVTLDSPEMTALSQALQADATGLKVNGKSLAANAQSGKFTDFGTIPSFYREPNRAIEIANKAGTIRSSQVNVLLGLTSDELVYDLMPAIEAGWGAAPRPVYIGSVFTRFTAGGMYSDESSVIKKYPTVQSRFLGIDFSGDANRLDAIYNNALLGDPSYANLKPFEGYNALYDATFLLAAAAQGALSKNAGRVTGASLAKSMPDVTSAKGTEVEMTVSAPLGQTSFSEGLKNVRDGKPIALMGTTGKLVLDPGTGDRTMGASAFCVEGTGNSAKFVFYKSVYDPSTKQLTPAPTCF